MSKIGDFFKGFLDNGKNQKNNVPFLHEPIDLKSFSKQDIDNWKTDGGFLKFAELISTSFRNVLILGQQRTTAKMVSILDSSHSNGWFLHCEQLDFLNSHYKFLAYELSHKLKSSGYVIQLAEAKSTSKSAGVEMTTHYYLKPSIKNRFVGSGELANQLYGNITIEYKALNGSPVSFKFLAKAYQDSKFLPPKDFSELNSILFNH